MASISGSSIDLGPLPDMSTTLTAERSACSSSSSSSTAVTSPSCMPNCTAVGDWSTAGQSSASDGSACSPEESLPNAEAAGLFGQACSDRSRADPVPTFVPAAAAAMPAAADGSSLTPGSRTAAVSASSTAATVAGHALSDAAGARKAPGTEAAAFGGNGASGIGEKAGAGATSTAVASAAVLAANAVGTSACVSSGVAMTTSAASASVAAAAETAAAAAAAAAGPSAEGRSTSLPFGFVDTLSALAAVEAAVAAATAAVAATERGGPSVDSAARTLSASSPTPSFAGSEANSEASAHRRSLGRPSSRTGVRRPSSAAGSAASTSSDWEDKVRLNLEYISREKQRKFDEMMEAQRQAEEHRQRQEEQRRQRIEEVKRKEEERQRLVEERRLARELEKKEQWAAAQEKKSKQIGRPLEDMTTKHGRYEAYGFGSCTRRFDDILLIDPGRRSASISNLSARQLADGGGECAEGNICPRFRDYHRRCLSAHAGSPCTSVGDGNRSMPSPSPAPGPSTAAGTPQQPPPPSPLSLGLSPARGQLAKPMSLSAVNLSVSSSSSTSRAAPHRRAATLSPTAEVVGETSAEATGDAHQSTSAASGYLSWFGQQSRRRANPPSCASIMTHSALLKVTARSQPSLLLLNTSPVDRLSPSVGHSSRQLGPARTTPVSRLSVLAEERSHAAAAAAGTAHAAASLHAGTAVLQDQASAAYTEAEASKRRAKSTDSGVRQQGHARHSPGHLSFTTGSPAIQPESKGVVAKPAGSGSQKVSLSNATTPVAAHSARKGPAAALASSPTSSSSAVMPAVKGRPPSLDRGTSAPAPTAATAAVSPASHGAAVRQSPPSATVVDALANGGHEQNVVTPSPNESAGSRPDSSSSSEQHVVSSREKSTKAHSVAISKMPGGTPPAKELHGRAASGSVAITTMRKAVSVSVLTQKTVHGSPLPSSKVATHVAATASNTVKRSSVDTPGAVDVRGKVSGPLSASIRATGTTEHVARSDTPTTTDASKIEAAHSEVLDLTASAAMSNSSSSCSNIPSSSSGVYGGGETSSVTTTHVASTQPSEVGVHPAASEDDHESAEGTYKSKLAEKRRQARDKAEKEAEALRLKQEELRREAEEKLRREAEEQRRFEEEESRLAEEAHQAEEERLRRAIAEAEARRSAELAAAEAERRAKEEQDQKAKEESEKRERALREKIEKEDIERQERRKKLEAIMRRVKPADSPGHEAKKATSSGRSSPESRLATESSYNATSAPAAITSDVPLLSGLTPDTSLSLDSLVHQTTPTAVSSIHLTEPTRDDADSFLEHVPSGSLSSSSFSSSSATSYSSSSSHLSGALSSPRSPGQSQAATTAPEQLAECGSEPLPLFPATAVVVHVTAPTDAASSPSCRPAGTLLLPSSNHDADSSSQQHTSVRTNSAAAAEPPAEAAQLLQNGSYDFSSSDGDRWLTSRQSSGDGSSSSSSLCMGSGSSMPADGLLMKQGPPSGTDQHLTNGSPGSPDKANASALIAF